MVVGCFWGFLFLTETFIYYEGQYSIVHITYHLVILFFLDMRYEQKKWCGKGSELKKNNGFGGTKRE